MKRWGSSDWIPAMYLLHIKKIMGRLKEKDGKIYQRYTRIQTKRKLMWSTVVHIHKKKQEKVKLCEGKGTKESLFSGNMIEYIENSRKFTHTPLELMKEFG